MNRSQPAKRKFPFAGLQRRVRARKEEPEPDFGEDYDSQSSQGENGGDDDREASEASDSPQSESEAEEEEEQSEDDEEPANRSLVASQISFGALAKAQATLPGGRKKHQGGGDGSEPNSDDDDDDSEPEEFDRNGISKPKRVAGRAHKHAPAEMTSKRPVTRRRQVVEVNKRQARDPRFGPPVGGGAEAEHEQDVVRRNYSFLNTYRDSEMSALRTRVKKTKDPFEKQRLERELMSMQSRKQAQERKDAARKVIEEHRKQEKELVKQGKNPFYLKKSEQKKRVLVERFQGMKKRQVDKAIVRKRKKETAKERKELPMERRAR
ncbi:putative rRNA biogenesis protein RRP36 [Seiridium cardinale]|uniref:rRNA biogenesis protein RRP36 n=1 Tax=Seiridium cardinale TaxID=138064 RepID=A0ABR2XPF9_9PEZI